MQIFLQECEISQNCTVKC